MFVAMMAFYAKISDPLIGGTYMTLLNTITNFGKLRILHSSYQNIGNLVIPFFIDYFVVCRMLVTLLQ